MEYLVRFEVPMVVTINITVFWDVTPSNLLDKQLPTLKMEAECSSTMWVFVYQITPRHIPEDGNLKVIPYLQNLSIYEHKVKTPLCFI
jgi:hypothetical protein